MGNYTKTTSIVTLLCVLGGCAEEEQVTVECPPDMTVSKQGGGECTPIDGGELSRSGEEMVSTQRLDAERLAEEQVQRKEAGLDRAADLDALARVAAVNVATLVLEYEERCEELTDDFAVKMRGRFDKKWGLRETAESYRDLQLASTELREEYLQHIHEDPTVADRALVIALGESDLPHFTCAGTNNWGY